jgi:hypothetical protein
VEAVAARLDTLAERVTTDLPIELASRAVEEHREKVT